MVEIFLIKQNNEFIKIRGIPEKDERRAFVITVDAKRQEIIENNHEMNNHIAHAAFRIYDEYEQNEIIPPRIIEMWC